MQISLLFAFFFFNDTATTEIYTLSLHDALPICPCCHRPGLSLCPERRAGKGRSEEHTSELQSRLHLVCRLLLEKKKNNISREKQYKKKKKKMVNRVKKKKI